MKLKVLRLYDDAWGTAQVVSGGLEGERTEGSFPIVRLPFRIHIGTKLIIRYAYQRDRVSEHLLLIPVKGPLIDPSVSGDDEMGIVYVVRTRADGVRLMFYNWGW
jgi:hypothetical protein